MAIVDINLIKEWFKTGKKPTQLHFWNWIDSFHHKNETIPQSSITDLENTLAAKAERQQFDAHLSDPDAHAEIMALKANIADISLVGLSGEWNDINNKPDFYPPSNHTHPVSEITGIEAYAKTVEVEGLVNGLILSANQATSEIYLKNSAGDILATINVGFLNNEGTTFSFNAGTGLLELKNDADEVLTSIPVSAFVTNLIHSVEFNGATPSILEFKDSANNVIDSLQFSVTNVNGLQALLDSKVSITGNQTVDGVKSWVQGDINTFGGATGTNVALRKLNNLLSYANSQPTVDGSVQIKLPIRIAQNNMWQMTVQLFEYQAATGSKPPVELIITGYTDTNSHATVSCLNPDAITQVRFGRNVANDATIIIIDKTGQWTYPKVIIKELVYHHSSNDVVLLNPANYSVTISTIETDYVAQISRTVGQFSRDQYFRDASNLNAGVVPYARLPFASTDVDKWNASVSTSHGNPKGSVTYGSGGESLNSLPKGTYTAAISTLSTDKPFTNTGALISVGDLSVGYQILGSRTGTEFWFRPYSTTYGAWVKLYSSTDITATNIANWSTAYGWGNHFGLYMPLGTNIPNAADLNTYQSTGVFNCISNTIAAAGSNYPSPVAGTLTVAQSANALVYQRYHTGGGGENNVYVRVLAGGTWSAWNKLWGSKDFSSSTVTNWNTAFTNSHTHANKTVLDGITAGDIDNWNNSNFTSIGWGEGIEVNPLFAGNITSITDARIVRVDSTQAQNLPEGVGNGVLVSLAGKPTYGDSMYTFHDVNGDFYVGRQGGQSMVWKKVAFIDDIYGILGATHLNSTMPTLTYLGTNFPDAPDGFEYRCPLTTPPTIFKKCGNGQWLKTACEIVT